ncbi:hypothetical protein ABPG73_018915 [Tetrahymena malaccensis]
MSSEYKQIDKFIVCTNKQLGQGAFGQVVKGFLKDNHAQQVAVKIISLQKVAQDSNFIKLLRREIEILQKINHPNVVKLHYATRTTNNLYMFLEYCADGDLKKLLEKRGGKLPESEAVQYFRQICEGFKELYKNSIIHRDIKPANILLHKGVAHITDFGFARTLDCSGMNNQLKMTYLGTPLYMSPQILAEEYFSSKCDIWSLGMMFYELLYGRTPWTGKTPNELLENIRKKPLEFPEQPPRSEIVKDMLRRMLVYEDSERISWEELFQHKIIKFDNEEVSRHLAEIELESNALYKSAARNEYYVNTIRVVGVDKKMQINAFNTDKDNLMELTTVGEDNSSSELQVKESSDQINMERVAEIQRQQKQRRDQIMKIDSYLTFDRNLGIFVNFTTNMIFKLYKEQILKMPEDLFYRIIFLLQKNQLIGFQYLIDCMMDKTQQSKFPPEQWKNYIQSKEYQETLQMIRQDIQYVKPYFQEVYVRAANYLQKIENSPKIKEFFSILNQELNMNDQNFQKILKSNLQEFIDEAFKLVPNTTNKKRELLQCIKYTFICKNPQQTFQWKEEDISSSDFHEFYDEYDNKNEQQLYDEVVKDLKTVEENKQ